MDTLLYLREHGELPSMEARAEAERANAERKRERREATLRAIARANEMSDDSD